MANADYLVNGSDDRFEIWSANSKYEDLNVDFFPEYSHFWICNFQTPLSDNA